MTDTAVVTSGYAAQLQMFAVRDDELFTGNDIHAINQLGLDGWAVALPESSWRDAPVPLDRIPATLRSHLTTRAIAHLKINVRYATPVRHLGRVLIYVILPAPDRQAEGSILVRVVRPQPALPAAQPISHQNQGSQAPQREVVRPRRDPPVPWPVLGLLDARGMERHAQVIRDFLGGGNAATIDRAMPELLDHFVRAGQATRSEVFYFFNAMDALKTGAWMQNPDYYNLLLIEEILSRSSTSFNPLQAQQLVQAHMIEGRPIEWDGHDPFVIEMQV